MAYFLGVLHVSKFPQRMYMCFKQYNKGAYIPTYTYVNTALPCT